MSFVADNEVENEGCEGLPTQHMSVVETAETWQSPSSGPASYPEGSMLLISCQRGFKLAGARRRRWKGRGNRTSGSVRCRRGRWRPSKPTCLPQTRTSSCLFHAQSESNNTVLAFSGDRRIAEGQRFFHGDELVFRCVDIGEREKELWGVAEEVIIG